MPKKQLTKKTAAHPDPLPEGEGDDDGRQGGLEVGSNAALGVGIIHGGL